MTHQLILLSQKTADWPESAPANAFNMPPGMVVLTIAIAVVAAICLLSTMIWVCTGENLIEQIDELLRTDIESNLEKWADKRELKKFKQGDIRVLMKRCDRYNNSPDFMSYKYDVPSGVLQQEIFDFNLALLKYWVMREADATWENMAHCICYNKDVLWKLLSYTSKEDPIIVSDELLKALLAHKEDFYNGLKMSMNIKAYTRKWTLFWYSAEAGNNNAKELLDWIDAQIVQGGVEKC